MSDGISNKQYVGVDLHLHRSVIVRIDERGQQLDCVQIDNDSKALVPAPFRNAVPAHGTREG